MARSHGMARHGGAAATGGAATAGGAAAAGGAPDGQLVGGASGDTTPASSSYAVYNAPLPLTQRQSLDVKLILALLSSIFLLVPFCYIPASAAVFVVRERVCKSKHLQLVSGAQASVYWAATYVWDMLVYGAVVLGCMLVFAAYAEPSFMSTPAQALAVLLTLLMYGASVLPLVYCYSFLFDSPTTAQISIIIFNLVASFGMVLAHQIMQVLPNTRDTDAALVWVYRLLPGYNFGEGIILITTTFYENELLGTAKSPLAWEVAGRPLMFMACEAVAYGALLMRLERSQEAYAKLEPCLATLCGVPEPSLALSVRTKVGVSLAGLLALIVLSRGGGAALVALLLLCTAVGLALWYERRLRSSGRTAEARARAELAAREGAGEGGFVEEEDVAAERRRVEGLSLIHI